MDASLRIDPDTGDILVGSLRLGRHTTTQVLRAIDPEHFERRPADGDNFFCDFAKLERGTHRIYCQSYHREGSVLTYTFQPCFPGDSWDNLTEDNVDRKLGLLNAILEASGIAPEPLQDFAWGHLGARYEARDGITSIVVAYYRRVAA